MIPNPPYKRFRYIAQQQGQRDPDVVLDTFLVLADAVGIDHPENDYVWADIWGKSWNPDRKAQLWRYGLMTLPYAQWSRAAGPSATGAPPSEIAVLMAERQPVAAQRRGGKRSQVTSVNIDERRVLDVALRDLREDPRMQRGRDSDALWPWVARELVKAKRRYREMPRDYVTLLDTLDGKGPALALWQRERRIDLGRYSLEEALAELEDFEVDVDEVPQGRVVFTFDDDWTVQQLRGEDQLEAEGEAMQHCVGDYCEEVEEGSTVIYSLRDPRGRPHVTMELRPTMKRFVQVYGKQNTEPKPEYMERVKLFSDETGIKPFGELTADETRMAVSYGERLAEREWLRMGDAVGADAPGGASLRATAIADMRYGAEQGGWFSPTEDALSDMIEEYPRREGAYGDYGEYMVGYQFDEGTTVDDLENVQLDEPLDEAIAEGFKRRWLGFVDDLESDLSYAADDALNEIRRRAWDQDWPTREEASEIVDKEIQKRTGGNHHPNDAFDVTRDVIDTARGQGLLSEEDEWGAAE